MTNVEILEREKERLFNEGKIQMIKPNIYEPLNTYIIWKQLGYQVKKGEHAILKCTIWKTTTKKSKNENGEEIEEEKQFLTTAHFFKFSQVEKVEKS